MKSIPTVKIPEMPEIFKKAKEIHHSFHQYYYNNAECIVNELTTHNYGVLLHDNILYWKIVDRDYESDLFKQANRQNIKEFFTRFIRQKLSITTNMLEIFMDAKTKLEEIYVPNFKKDTSLTRAQRRKIEISYKHYEAELSIWEIFVCEHNALVHIVSSMHGHVVEEYDYAKKYLKEKVKKYKRNKRKHFKDMQTVWQEMEFAWDAIKHHKEVNVWINELENLSPFKKRFHPFLKSPICAKNKNEATICRTDVSNSVA